MNSDDLKILALSKKYTDTKIPGQSAGVVTDDSITLVSSTPNSTKKLKITIDDDSTIFITDTESSTQVEFVTKSYVDSLIRGIEYGNY